MVLSSSWLVSRGGGWGEWREGLGSQDFSECQCVAVSEMINRRRFHWLPWSSLQALAKPEPSRDPCLHQRRATAAGHRGSRPHPHGSPLFLAKQNVLVYNDFFKEKSCEALEWCWGWLCSKTPKMITNVFILFHFIFQTIWTCQLNASLLVYSRAAVGTLIML